MNSEKPAGTTIGILQASDTESHRLVVGYIGILLLFCGIVLSLFWAVWFNEGDSCYSCLPSYLLTVPLFYVTILCFAFGMPLVLWSRKKADANSLTNAEEKRRQA